VALPHLRQAEKSSIAKGSIPKGAHSVAAAGFLDTGEAKKGILAAIAILPPRPVIGSVTPAPLSEGRAGQRCSME
jgi:hypothetical protein